MYYYYNYYELKKIVPSGTLDASLDAVQLSAKATASSVTARCTTCLCNRKVDLTSQV